MHEIEKLINKAFDPYYEKLAKLIKETIYKTIPKEEFDKLPNEIKVFITTYIFIKMVNLS